MTKYRLTFWEFQTLKGYVICNLSEIRHYIDSWIDTDRGRCLWKRREFKQ
jgi:repressor of nif and glnA expression